MKSLLDPLLNYPVTISIVTRSKTLLSNGRTSATTVTKSANAVWIENGVVQKRSNRGLVATDVVEVHLGPEWSTLEPGQDYFVKSGLKYRITSRSEMSRMTGSVMFIAERRDGE